MMNTYTIICIYTLSKYTYILPILLNTWQVSIKDPYFSWISSWKNKNNLTNLVNLLETGRPTNRHRWEVIVLFPRSQNRWLPERPKKRSGPNSPKRWPNVGVFGRFPGVDREASAKSMYQLQHVVAAYWNCLRLPSKLSKRMVLK